MPLRVKNDRGVDLRPDRPSSTQLGWEPKREWVDLTHEEMKEIWDGHGWYVTLFEKVQAKLKEKNGG